MRRRPSALGLFCGGGGACEGLRRAGFAVTGVDIAPQRHYPFPFVRADVLSLDPTWLEGFDLVWASPPCQRFTRYAHQARTAQDHPDLIDPTRALLAAAEVPSVIENVPESPLRVDLTLCGAMFDLRLVRHRVFELSGFKVDQPAHVPHRPDYVMVTGETGGSSRRDGGAHFGLVADWREAMGHRLAAGVATEGGGAARLLVLHRRLPPAVPGGGGRGVSEPGRWRKRPVVVEAIRYDGSNGRQVVEWAPPLLVAVRDGHLAISTAEGVMRADAGDWIIRGVEGELYPCKPSIFDATYQPEGDLT